MNSLVFNSTANQLMMTVGNSSLTVAGSVTVANTSLTVAGSVTVSNSLTVTGTVTVSEITNPVTIGNASLTIDGSVTVSNTSLTVAGTVTVGNTSLTVAGTVTVSEITNPVTIGNASLTVAGSVTINNATITSFISGNAFTSLTVTSTVVTGTGVVFSDTDISQQKTASIFVYNEGANTLTLSLQISPTTTDTDYIDDPAYSSITIAGTTSQYIAIAKYAHYARLQYVLGGTTATFSAYYNAQV